MPRESINVTSATVAGISITVGDEIVDSQGNKYKITSIGNAQETVVATTNITIKFCDLVDEYQKVVGD